MKNFFVIGNRTSKSLSPLIFNHWFKKYNIKAKYFFVEVNKRNFNKVLLNKIQNEKTTGFNITIPYKKDILKYLDVKNIHAENIGAVNCVTIGRKIKGINTDWLGYLNSIKHLKIKKNKKILILGCGGAAQAIIYGFFLKGFENVIVFNRSKKVIRFGKTKTYTKKYSLIDNYIKKADLLINTTPTNPLNIKQIKVANKNIIVSDIVYKPKHTTFLNTFKENRKVHGASMLIEQAVLCFIEWFGFEPKIDENLIKKISLKIK